MSYFRITTHLHVSSEIGERSIFWKCYQLPLIAPKWMTCLMVESIARANTAWHSFVLEYFKKDDWSSVRGYLHEKGYVEDKQK